MHPGLFKKQARILAFSFPSPSVFWASVTPVNTEWVLPCSRDSIRNASPGPWVSPEFFRRWPPPCPLPARSGLPPPVRPHEGPSGGQSFYVSPGSVSVTFSSSPLTITWKGMPICPRSSLLLGEAEAKINSLILFFLSFIPSANSGWTPVSFSVIINQMEVSVKMFLIISNQIIKMCLLYVYLFFICFKTGIVDHRATKPSPICFCWSSIRL